ncbi:hypothetical protein Clopa_4557 [Clostridium pasteurianum BC1]|uniref:Uncharacterized protein n=1 Tax=Clostridium pasteurianum BC1 TaxID=86416 RepID=R4K7U2_CLOPA|nr:hypothetical protein Clopa_4557 [Clostridium pasteurianum BC1]
MPFLSLIISSPLIYISYVRKHTPENFYSLKLICIWILSQIYITINYEIPFPIGIIANIILISNTENNKSSKYTALLIGAISLVISNCISILCH